MLTPLSLLAVARRTAERDIDAAVTKTDEVLRSVSAYTDPSKVLSVLFAAASPTASVFSARRPTLKATEMPVSKVSKPS